MDTIENAENANSNSPSKYIPHTCFIFNPYESLYSFHNDKCSHTHRFGMRYNHKHNQAWDILENGYESQFDLLYTYIPIF